MMWSKLLPNVGRPRYWQQMGQEVLLIGALLRDRRVPMYAKVIPLFVAIYLVLPVDLLPTFLPIIGQLDDLALLMLGLRAFTYLAPNEVVAEHQKRMGVSGKVLL